jgi:hypothetical protein
MLLYPVLAENTIMDAVGIINKAGVLILAGIFGNELKIPSHFGYIQ